MPPMPSRLQTMLYAAGLDWCVWQACSSVVEQFQDDGWSDVEAMCGQWLMEVRVDFGAIQTPSVALS